MAAQGRAWTIEALCYWALGQREAGVALAAWGLGKWE